MKGIIGERRENEWEKLERETNCERLLTLGNEQRVVEREGVGVTGWRALVGGIDLMSPG